MLDLQRAMQLEFAPHEQIRDRQDRLLRKHLAYLAAHSPYYRQMFSRLGIGPPTIRTLADLRDVPFTTKNDIERSPKAFLCVDERQIVDICLTSGTMGAPVALPQTAADLKRLADNEALAFLRMGLGPGDRVLVAVALERCFMAGLAYFLGLNRIGATAIRGGSGSIPHLVDLVKNQRPTAIVGVPSLLRNLAEQLGAQGFDPATAGVGKVLCIGEPVRTSDFQLSPIGERLSQAWQAAIYGTYASTGTGDRLYRLPYRRRRPPLAGVGGCGNCRRERPARAGGCPGEVVATPLQVTGMPLLRFRTGDIAAFIKPPCRLRPDQPAARARCWAPGATCLKVRGTTVYPVGRIHRLAGVSPRSAVTTLKPSRFCPLRPAAGDDRVYRRGLTAERSAEASGGPVARTPGSLRSSLWTSCSGAPSRKAAASR